ncbi:hypothetical protein ACU4GD_16250 [Cupriavidus basilensis]
MSRAPARQAAVLAVARSMDSAAAGIASPGVVRPRRATPHRPAANHRPGHHRRRRRYTGHGHPALLLGPVPSRRERRRQLQPALPRPARPAGHGSALSGACRQRLRDMAQRQPARPCGQPVGPGSLCRTASAADPGAGRPAAP